MHSTAIFGGAPRLTQKLCRTLWTHASQRLNRRSPTTGHGVLRVLSSRSEFYPMPPLDYKDPYVVPATGQHSATVFMLHGLGDTSDGWADVASQSAWGRNLRHVKFILPTAPIRPVTLNFGMPFTAWYDIDSLNADNRREDEGGLNESYRYLSELVEKEIQSGIPSDRIVVAGFSQGGAVALSMLRSPHKLAAIIGMSCYLPRLNNTPVVSEANRTTPVLMCHGIHDPMIAFEYGETSFKYLQTELQTVSFKEYDMAHSACQQELMDTREFLESVLGT